MITSRQNPTVKDARRLNRKKYRDQTGMMLIEGPHLVEEATRKGLVQTVFILKRDPAHPGAIVVSEDVMRHLCDAKSAPPVAAVVNDPPKRPPGKKVLILENIQDPGNVGTLIRTALAFGFETVIEDECADYRSAKVLRSTQGAIFHLNILSMDVETFKENHPSHTLIGAHVRDGSSPPKHPRGPFALILGNEGQGLKERTLRLLDDTVHIPLITIDSLNVGVAGAIIMHALTSETPLFED